MNQTICSSSVSNQSLGPSSKKAVSGNRTGGKTDNYVHCCSPKYGQGIVYHFPSAPWFIHEHSTLSLFSFLFFFPLLYLFSIHLSWTPNFPLQTCSSSFTVSSVSGMVSNHPLISARKKPATHLVKTQPSHTFPYLTQYWGLSSAYCLMRCLKLRSIPTATTWVRLSFLPRTIAAAA